MLGVRREAIVEALKLQSYGDNLVIEYIGYLRADYMLRRPASFCTLEVWTSRNENRGGIATRAARHPR